LIENIKVINPKIINNKYVSFFAKSKSNKLISAISFNLLESEISGHLLNNKNTLNLIVQLKENLWNNKKSLQLIVLDIIQNSNNA
jgi:single-stranded-DNA-specific exonuclease